MTRRETNYAADTRLALRAQQVVLGTRIHRDVGQKRAKVILENKGTSVGWIPLTTCTRIARTEIAPSIKRGA